LTTRRTSFSREALYAHAQENLCPDRKTVRLARKDLEAISQTSFQPQPLTNDWR
jgi:hypothetical protein